LKFCLDSVAAANKIIHLRKTPLMTQAQVELSISVRVRSSPTFPAEVLEQK